MRLSALRPEAIQRLIAAKTATDLSPRTVQYIHSVLHRALKHAARWGLIVQNVADLADSPRPRRAPMCALTPDQARQFLAGVKDDPLSALYIMAVTTGMRQGELLGLRWAGVDLDAALIHVNHAM